MALETYRCQKCKHTYNGVAGPTACPACGSVWVDWLTYKKNFGDK